MNGHQTAPVKADIWEENLWVVQLHQPRCFALMSQIWWSYLEGMMSYGADKLGVDAHTHEHTHRQTQAMTIPEGHNWPWVKTALGLVEEKSFIGNKFELLYANCKSNPKFSFSKTRGQLWISNTLKCFLLLTPSPAATFLSCSCRCFSRALSLKCFIMWMNTYMQITWFLAGTFQQARCTPPLGRATWSVRYKALVHCQASGPEQSCQAKQSPCMADKGDEEGMAM